MKIEKFFSFTGLHYGDTIDQIIDLFGIPDDEYKNPHNSYTVFYYKMYNDDILSISFSNADFKVESIFLGLHSSRPVKHLLEKFRIVENKASFIGNTMDQIIDYFGIPDEQHREFISYSSQKLEVEFYCPYDEKSLCTRIKVKWYYPK
jgi:hypothetical protein